MNFQSIGRSATMTCLAVFAAGSGPAFAAQDCTLGQRYLVLARDNEAGGKLDEALDYLRQSAAVCPAYSTYQRMGDLFAGRSTDEADKVKAVEAYVSAHELATTDREQATALRAYAELLAHDVKPDPQNAWPLILEARRLQPDDAQIARLAKEVERQVNNPTPEQNIRGLRNELFRPLKRSFASNKSDSPRPLGAGEGVGSGSGGGSAKSAAPASQPVERLPAPVAARPSINVPINFRTDSTAVDEQTRTNVAVLARTLADPRLEGQHFVFVGHADIRGREAHNALLSKQRAQAVYDELLLSMPSLKGRVRVEGHGSSEPVDVGNTEEAHRRNRRLQVLLE